MLRSKAKPRRKTERSSTEDSLGRRPGKRALLRQMQTTEQRLGGNGGKEGWSHTDVEEEQVDHGNSRCKGQFSTLGVFRGQWAGVQRAGGKRERRGQNEESAREGQ